MTTGTSFAAAHVSGIAALILRASSRHLTPDAVRRVLLSTARDLGPAGRDKDFGAGLADAYDALISIGASPLTPCRRRARRNKRGVGCRTERGCGPAMTKPKSLLAALVAVVVAMPAVSLAQQQQPVHLSDGDFFRLRRPSATGCTASTRRNCTRNARTRTGATGPAEGGRVPNCAA